MNPMCSHCFRSLRNAPEGSGERWMNIAIILAAMMMGFSEWALGADSLAVSVQAAVVPSTTVTVAESAQVVVEVASDDKVAVSSYALADAADLIVGKPVITQPSKAVDGKWKSRVEFTVTALNVGELEFPALSLWFNADGDKSGSIQTRPLKLSAVNPVQGQVMPEMIRDLKPIFKETGLFWLWMALFVLIAGGIIYSKVYRNRVRPGENLLPPEPPRPSDEIALEKLELAYRQYTESGDFKLFYSEMSVILRTYLSAQFSLDTLEKTTSEIFAEMRMSGVDRKIAQETRELLSASDLVKFAKFVPDAGNVSDEFERTKKLVLETAEKAEPVDGESR